MKLRNVIQLLLLATVIMFTAPSCVKEGPMGLTGPSGEKGIDGKDGKDVNETCKMCHSPASVDLISTQFQLSKHEYGEAAFEEAGVIGCTPCHAQEAFKDIVKRNVSSEFTVNADGKYSLKYNTLSTTAYGEIGCSTCHSDLHTTYGTADLKFTTVAPVPMVMWGGKKTIDLKADGGVSNLCVKCHQPRPQSNMQTGNVQDYEAIAKNPTVLAWDSVSPTATTNIIRPGYRTHIHYGAVGAIYAGMGGVEFGTGYTNSKHTEVASCVDCHMGDMNGKAGGHTFFAKGNFNGCNVTGCHSTTPITAATTSKYWKQTRDEVKSLLNQIAAKLVVTKKDGTKIDILNRNSNTNEELGGVNLWAGLTTNNYDGYLNIYDPSSNPTGELQNPSSNNFTAAQKAINNKLPKLSLTNAQYGAILNFQLCLRDYSLGIHNTAYTKTLLNNTLAVLP